ncbi:DUF4870 domain-containing protein [Microbacterium sp.]|uniref:DUF4870 domain-containing protein n=1 Tax=Microbacterium sp. TaxID=51671 RepID=UPI0039E3C689
MTDPQEPQPGQVTPPPSAPTPPPAASTPPPSGATTPPPAATPPSAPYAAAAPAGPLTPEQDRTWAMWAHIGGVVGFLPSLIIWLLFKDRGPRTNVEAKEALNWQITFTIFYVAALIVTSILSGLVWVLGLFLWLVPLAIWVLNVVFSIQGGMRVNNGGSYQYPINFRLIK